MSDEEELAIAVEKALERCDPKLDVSPSWIATQVMVDIEFPRSLHRLGYAGCHLEIRQIARGKLRRRFDPTADDEDDDDAQGELDFPGTLQERYPRARKTGEEPYYAPLDKLTDADVEFNVKAMRRRAGALLEHARLLEEWNISRRAAS